MCKEVSSLAVRDQVRDLKQGGLWFQGLFVKHVQRGPSLMSPNGGEIGAVPAGSECGACCGVPN